MWALVAAAVASITPWLMLFAVPTTPDDTVPGWVYWAILLVWILAGAFGVAYVIVGGRIWRIGAALVVGDALGVLLFFISIWLAYSLAGGS